MNTVHLSTHAGKLEGLQSISTSTLTNRFCSRMRKTDSICRRCYASRIEAYRPGLANRLNENSELLSSQLLNDRQLPVINALHFRFNSFGELINATHFINLLRITEFNPETTFALWTKRTNIVHSVLSDRSKPSNLILIHSTARIDQMPNSIPRYFDKTFSTVSDKNHLGINCSQKCKNCLLCYTHNPTHHIVELIK